MKFLPVVAIVAAFAVAGCESTPEPTSTPTTTNTAAGGPAPNSIEYFNQVVGDRVFFATDQQCHAEFVVLAVDLEVFRDLCRQFAGWTQDQAAWHPCPCAAL